jgi:signal transduction histidine kinase/CheY-like chemotaxis protein/PAS domain-containing protein
MTDEPEVTWNELIDQREVLAEFGHIALKTDNLQDILEEACRLVGRGLRVDLAKILELQPGGDTLLVRAGVGWKDGIVGRVTVPVEPRSSESQAINTGEPFVCDDVENEQHFTIPDFLREHGVRSLVNVPILGSGTEPPYGVLQIDSRKPRAFTRTDIDFLRGYANLLASSIKRLTLLPKLEAAIEEKKHLLQELEERMKIDLRVATRFRFLTEASSEVMYQMNADWSEMRYLSGAAFIADTEKPNRQWLEDYIPPEDQPRVMAATQEALQTKGTFELEHRVRSVSGAVAWMHSRAVRVLDAHGATEEWFGVASDITARKLAERRQTYRLDLNEQLRALADPQAMMDAATAALGSFLAVAQVGCAEIDEAQQRVIVHRDWNDGRILSVVGTWRMEPFAPAFIAEMKRGGAEMKRGGTVAIPDVREDPRTCAPEAVAAYESIAIRSILDVPLARGGGMVALLFIHHPVPRAWTPDEVAIAEDTGEWLWSAIERVRAEAALRAARDKAHEARNEAEAANQAKSKFLAAASHDLRQPMQSLLLFLDVLKPHVAPDGQEALRHLGRALDALRDLLDCLLDISRFDAGVVLPSIEDFAVQDLVEQIAAAYTPVAAAKGIAFQIAACPAVVRSDRTLLSRMVRNLVENALRYTETGRIAIECQEADFCLRIEVHDTGIGIPPEHLGRIWEEFHQVGNPERDRNRGLGLGLAIVQRLSVLLEHPVEVRSAPGRGSIFSIEVPLGEAVPAQPPALTAEVVGNGRFAVLVDDDAIVLLGLKAMFEAWGYKVLAAGSTDRALAALERIGQRPDIVVADYRLREGRNGTEAILAVREAYGADVPGVILTGETGSEVHHAAAVSGLRLIHKPVTPRQLGEALQEILAHDG